MGGDAGGGAGAVRAIHEVISSALVALPETEERLGCSAGGGGDPGWRDGGSSQVFQVGWEGILGGLGVLLPMVGLVVGPELYGEGLKTSSEPRESLGAGGMRGDCLFGWSIGQDLHGHHTTKLDV